MPKQPLYFVTNRNVQQEKPAEFGIDISSRGDLRFGRVDGKKVTLLPDNPQEGSEALFADLQKEMGEGEQDLLIFIHGFNTSFDKAVKWFRALYKGAEKELVPLFWSWPSDGKMHRYNDDRSDAMDSGPAIARSLKKLVDFLAASEKQCGRRIHIVTHSMGALALRYAVQEYSHRFHDCLPRLFDNVVLIAADDDTDALNEHSKMRPLIHICKKISVYYNDEDTALWCSDTFKGNRSRLGTTGPELPLPIGSISALDCSEHTTLVGDGDAFNHDYAIKSDTVRKDILATIRGDRRGRSGFHRL